MYDILIKQALFKGERVDLAIAGSQIVALAPTGTLLRDSVAREVIDGAHFLLRAPFYNTHTHHAMTLLRGIDDDCALMDWLQRCIWPREAHLTEEAVYTGTQLAIVESIRSGCVAFNDMYFHQPQILRAAQALNVRAQVGLMYMDQVSEHVENEATFALRNELPDTIRLCVAPHALYTTTEEQLKELALFAAREGFTIHMHAAESKAETQIARNRFGASSPIRYLDRCGLLRENTILAHGCYLDDEDREILAKRGCVIAHCPHSNQKLASGTFEMAKALKAGIKVTVGTDGAASNNSLSMIVETKSAALVGKLVAGSPDAIPFDVVDRAVTEVAAHALGFKQAGKIAVGADADVLLVDMRAPAFIGTGNADANFIYAGDSSLVDTVICAGKVLMRHKVISGEAEILQRAQLAAERLQYACQNA